MINITGIGWIGPQKYGCLMRRYSRSKTDIKSLYSKLRQESILLDDIKNFGRFDDVSKFTCCAAGLALYDAKRTHPFNSKDNVGLIGTNTNGCLESNLRYFQDYIKSGRTLARGNLFTYTLPSSPMADAAIYLGLKGPLLYMGFQQKQVSSLLQQAKIMIQSNEAEAMLAVKADQEKAICFICEKNPGVSSENMFILQDIIQITDRRLHLQELIAALEKNSLRKQQ